MAEYVVFWNPTQKYMWSNFIEWTYSIMEERKEADELFFKVNAISLKKAKDEFFKERFNEELEAIKTGRFNPMGICLAEMGQFMDDDLSMYFVDEITSDEDKMLMKYLNRFEEDKIWDDFEYDGTLDEINRLNEYFESIYINDFSDELIWKILRTKEDLNILVAKLNSI